MSRLLEITISPTPPPNLQSIEKTFGALMLLELKPVFCYGGTIHNPFEQVVTGDVITHEAVHAKQQGNDPAGWWNKYLDDPEFRLSQEIEAYQAQYRYWCSQQKDRNKQMRFALALAQNLSGSLYGNLISTQEALALIRK